MSLGGLVVPTPTIFADDGSLHAGKNARYTRVLCDAGVDHIFALGTLGEFTSIRESERKALVESVIESLTGRADAWIGCGAGSTAVAVERAEQAEEAGAAAIVAVPPFFLRPTEAAIERYYRAIRAAVRLPVLAYNIPGHVGYALPAPLVGRLARAGTLQGLKDTSESFPSLEGFLAAGGPGFAVLPGDDIFASRAIAAGAAGAVMGMANLLPKLCVKLVAAATARDEPAARSLQATVDRLARVAAAGPFPSADKFLAAHLRGAEVGYRSPYDPLTSEEEQRVLAALAPDEREFRSYL